MWLGTAIAAAGTALGTPRTVPAHQAQQHVLQTDVADPTQDKPQSKLWYARGKWWAWLPMRGGSMVWERTPAGWNPLNHLTGVLRGLPGQADVWAAGDRARAVLRGPRSLVVVSLRYDRAARTFRLDGAPEPLSLPDERSGKGIETATIDRDPAGNWWVAYDCGRRIWAQCSRAEETGVWSSPIEIGSGIAEDDICALTAIPGGVGVMWSDQTREAVFFRQHRSSRPPELWQPVEIVDQGKKTADDHLHIAAAGDGRLFVATKNSLDERDQPQLVLRVRARDGTWTNLPFAPRTSTAEPTRPIALLTADSNRLAVIQATYGRGSRSRAGSTLIVRTTAPRLPDLSGPGAVLLGPWKGLNNPTGCKAPLPAGAPALILASDDAGRVYEVPLDP